ncbi:MAG: 4-hydroxythreonine-4-phosphate dehydrogenase PdxA [Myxococcaceae bacterium]|nr:4-hydroxythreonine-4-phosphate dehydrogenase PdxA [Myxococcaceae bacterium]
MADGALPIVGISLGDPSGIGPEIVAAALNDARVRAALRPVVFGDWGVLQRFDVFATWPRVPAPFEPGGLAPAIVEVSTLAEADRRPGAPTLAGGRAQYAYVQEAILAARRGAVDALCTAPVSKEQISRAGIPFMGHTEVLAEAFGVEVLMLMDGPRVRVALATNHVPLTRVAALLSVPKLVSQLRLLSRSLEPVVGRRPKIAVCGLNPHAGEGGLLGREEVEVIAPAIERARAEGLDVHGPLPADGLFARAARGIGFDAVLAMFHDQGLVAAKALDFERTVNVTLGLPVPRTSPDHGVAYDIAGQGVASADPMIAALLSAARLAAR